MYSRAIDITSLTFSHWEQPLELTTLESAFHTQQYGDVIAFDVSGLSPESRLAVSVFQLRARIACGELEAVLQEIANTEIPDLVSVKSIIQHAEGNFVSALDTARGLAVKWPENATVNLLCAKVLYAEGLSEEALSKHQRDLEMYVCSVLPRSIKAICIYLLTH